MRRVTVILTDAQYEQVKKAAGLVPLSAWFRQLGLDASDPDTIAKFRELADAVNGPLKQYADFRNVTETAPTDSLLGQMRDSMRGTIRAGDPHPEHKSLWMWRKTRGQAKRTCRHGAEPRRAGVNPADVTFADAPQADRPAGYSKLVDGRIKRTCKHGIERGYNCWQCGGLAVIE